ncbi:AraC family transcriptional regulator [Rosenbergiella epipactidis]|uniref:AraC family transcriptional regulator n=1 Tax=Rosenbergiella epipactidis TaxID=1544694 RepID=UPI001F501626|nr:helix-turn-helix transcriptional regulator [Rosenbergiella epipactidis]
MPATIDKAPRHSEAVGWSCTAIDYQQGEEDPPHYHREGQLLYATRGVMLVKTEGKSWVIPPQRALWIPPLHEHSYQILSQTHLRAVYFSRPFIEQCDAFVHKEDVHVISTTPLLKILISSLFEQHYSKQNQRKIAELLVNLFHEAQPLAAELPMPEKVPLSLAIRPLIIEQRWNLPMSDLADIALLSERSFTRLFKADTGISFRVWKQRARIYLALDLLAKEVSIKQVAYQLGFSSPASFTAAFRSITGSVPRDFKHY